MKVGYLHVLLLCYGSSPVFLTCDKDYYSVLDLKRSATEDEIKRAYKKLLLKLHPDKNKHDDRAHEKAILLNEAYSTLKDKKSRNLYDRKNPSAGKGTKTYEWEKHINHEPRNYVPFRRLCSYVWNAIVKASQWLFVLHYRGRSENDRQSIVWGMLLAFSASYVQRSPILMFLMLWFAVLDKLHLAVMICITVKSLRLLKLKYLPCLIFLWMIYLFILDYVHGHLRLELRLRILIFLFQNSAFIVLYCTTSLLTTAIIFWIYKPQQNIQTKRIILLLQHATASYYLCKSMPGKHFVDVLPFQLIVVAVSEFSILVLKIIWRFAKYVIHKLYSLFEDALRYIVNLFFSILWRSASVTNRILNLIFNTLLALLKMNYISVKFMLTIFSDMTKLAVIFGLRCLQFCSRSLPR